MNEQERREPVVIAVCGKGGVGKTSISAAMTKLLSANRENRVLAVDADPAVGLATALGFEGRKTVDDIRNRLISQVEGGLAIDRQELVSLLDYEVFDTLEENGNLAFLAIGRPEREGCYCQVNDLLKDIIRTLADNFDYVIIDAEAGVEQINRRVMESVTHLILVSDASAKGFKVARTIREVSRDTVACKRAGLIANRIRGQQEMDRVALPPDLPFIGWIPEDPVIREFDIRARNLLELPACPALEALARCLTGAGIDVGLVQTWRARP